MTWGRPVTDADGDRYRDLFAGLTPDEVRVITGLVRAMRECVTSMDDSASLSDRIRAAESMLLEASDLHRVPYDNGRQMFAEAAWHIAHAIAQMGES